MCLLENFLFIADSLLPSTGKGLFTKQFISKGTFIVEYKGKITSWKTMLSGKLFNGYVYYINRNHVIDAKPYKTALGKYANDANGLVKTKGLRNNSIYVQDNKRVYIKATENIAAGEEILVPYGKEYWDTIRANNIIGAQEK